MIPYAIAQSFMSILLNDVVNVLSIWKWSARYKESHEVTRRYNQIIVLPISTLPWDQKAKRYFLHSTIIIYQILIPTDNVSRCLKVVLIQQYDHIWPFYYAFLVLLFVVSYINTGKRVLSQGMIAFVTAKNPTMEKPYTGLSQHLQFMDLCTFWGTLSADITSLDVPSYSGYHLLEKTFNNWKSII